jgi:16S rRNA processing protein RimM
VSTEPVVVARITRPHGIKGWLLLQPETDHASEVFVPGRELRLVDPPEGLPEALTIVEAAPHGQVWRVLSEEVADRSAAERFRGLHLAVPQDELPELEEDEYFLHDLIGVRVAEADGRELGSVRDVYDGPSSPLLAVEVDGRERLIPFRPEFVVEVDLEAGVMRVSLPAGLLDV